MEPYLVAVLSAAVAAAGLFAGWRAARAVGRDRRADEERFRHLAAVVPQAVWVIDAAGRIEYVNDRWREYFGPAAVTTCAAGDWSSVLPPEDVAANNRRWAEFGRQGKPFQFDGRLRRADGTYRWNQVNGVPVRDAAGRVARWYGVNTDIHDRRVAEDALRESEARFRTMADHAPVMVWVTEPDGTCTFLSQSWYEFTGQTEADGLGFGWTAAVHPDDRAAAHDAFVGANAARAPFRVEYRLRRTDGTYRWMIDAAVPRAGAGGEFLGYIGSVIDITERKAAEAALDRYRLLSEHGRDIILFVRPGTARIVEANAAAEAAYGRTRAELVGLTLADLRTPDAHAPLHEQLARADAGGLTFETTHRRADGTPFPVEVSARGTDLGDDRVILSIIRDVTDRRAAEDRLRAGEARFRQLADVMPQVVWVADGAGVVRYYNSRARGFDGVQEEADGSWTWRPVLHPDDAARTLAVWEAAVATRTPYECEHRVRMTDGAYRWHLSRGVPVAGADDPWFGTATDIHDLKSAEERLEQADRRKDEFLATLAHELRNPLAPIRNAVHILKLGAAAGGPTGRQLDMMERQLHHMVRLIDDLLDASRITRGKLHLRRERVSLGAVVDVAVEATRPLVERHGHALAVEPPAAPVAVDGDPVRLAQVVTNLLTNAVKYTERGGRIALSAGRDGADAVVRVRDTGIGIPADQLGAVFELFSQVDRSLEKTTGGLGIGLALVRGLVGLHGGTVTAASPGPGLGSEFVVRLPALPDEPRAEPPPSAAGPAGGRRRRVLVADDNADAAESMAALLELYGHEVRTAEDGEEAVRRAEAFRPDVLLLDLGMPKMNGYDACRAVRARDWGRVITVIALTGWGAADDRRRTREAGFDHHLTKPVDPAQLRALLADPPAPGA
jgi:PAS domain S-box-containing protein